MKNVAIINVSDFGSTGKIALGLHNYLRAKGYNSFFCYCRGKKPADNTYLQFENEYGRHIHALATRITGRQGFYSKKATKKLIQFLDKNNIDTIFGECLHGYYLNENILFDYIAKRNIRFVYIMIDEYPYLGKCWNSGGCDKFLTGCGNCPQKKEYPKNLICDASAFIYRNKQKWYSKMNNSVFVGPEYVIRNAKKSPLTKTHNKSLIDFGINIDFYKPQNRDELKQKLGIPLDKIVFFSTAPIGTTKGGQFFIEIARMLQNDDRFVFIHAGNKEKPDNIPNNYLFVGFVPSAELPSYYSMADLFVFPSMLDTMPNACLEAISCGTPIVCFNCSGMPFLAGDDIETLVEPGDVEQLRSVILNTKQKTEVIERLCREYAINRYDSKVFFRKLVEIGEQDTFCNK